MTLSRSSVLHYWSSRYGPLPIIGGRPTHSRNSAGSVADARGELYDAIINTPRFAWETDKATSANELRAMLLLELASTNRIPYSTDVTNAVWTATGASMGGTAPDPKGGAAAQIITATAANGQYVQTLAAGSSLVRTNSVWVRRRTGSGAVSLLTPDNSAFTAIAVGPTWQRFSLPGAASTARAIGIRLATLGDQVDVYNFQQEDAPFPTRDMPNPGASLSTRAVDAFSWAYSAPPQAMMLYVRHVERGTISIAGQGLWGIGDTGAAGPRLLLWASAAGSYQLYYQPIAAGASYTATLAGPSLGDTAETVAILTATGQVRLIQSINGAAVTDSGLVAGAALPTAWSALTMQLGQFSTTSPGVAAFADVRAVKFADVVASTAQGIMEELRAFELGPNGDVL